MRIPAKYSELPPPALNKPLEGLQALRKRPGSRPSEQITMHRVSLGNRLGGSPLLLKSPWMQTRLSALPLNLKAHLLLGQALSFSAPLLKLTRRLLMITSDLSLEAEDPYLEMALGYHWAMRRSRPLPSRGRTRIWMLLLPLHAWRQNRSPYSASNPRRQLPLLPRKNSVSRQRDRPLVLVSSASRLQLADLADCSAPQNPPQRSLQSYRRRLRAQKSRRKRKGTRRTWPTSLRRLYPLTQPVRRLTHLVIPRHHLQDQHSHR